MAKQEFPEVPKALLDYLQKVYPGKIPTDLTTSLDEFRILQGNRQVIELLQYQFDRQNTTVLEKS